MTSFDISGNVSATEAKTNTHGHPVEQGPVGRGDTQHDAAGRLLCLARVSQGNASSHPTPSHLWWCVRMSGDNLCPCGGCEWLFAALCLQHGVSSCSGFLWELLCSHALELSYVSCTSWTQWEKSRKICALEISF